MARKSKISKKLETISDRLVGVQGELSEAFSLLAAARQKDGFTEAVDREGRDAYSTLLKAWQEVQKAINHLGDVQYKVQ